MNKKVLPIILGIVVLFIWVKVFSKIFDQFGDDEYTSVEAPTMDAIDLSKYIKRDTIPTLNLDYRDPFLGKTHHVIKPKTNINPSQNNRVNRSNSINKNNLDNKTIRWPAINYHGFVKVIGSNSGTVLLKVGGRMHKTREGEVINNELIVKKVYRDSIVMTQNGEAKTFYK
ncbi:MAG: hypothetical protein WED10_05270 [Brumimicrobium sp.]